MGSLGNKKIMAKNIRRLMALRRINRITFSNDIGVSYTTVTDWIKGKTYPRIDKIEIMANYFGITKAELVEEYSKERDEIVALLPQLNDEDRKKVLVLILRLNRNNIER